MLHPHVGGQPKIMLERILHWLRDFNDDIARKLGPQKFERFKKLLATPYFDLAERREVVHILVSSGYKIKLVSTLFNVTGQTILNDLNTLNRDHVGCPKPKWIRRGRVKKTRVDVPKTREIAGRRSSKKAKADIEFSHWLELRWSVVKWFLGKPQIKTRVPKFEVLGQVLREQSMPEMSLPELRRVVAKLSTLGVLIPDSKLDFIIYYFYFLPNGVEFRSYSGFEKAVKEHYITEYSRYNGDIVLMYKVFAEVYLKVLGVNLNYASFRNRIEFMLQK